MSIEKSDLDRSKLIKAEVDIRIFEQLMAISGYLRIFDRSMQMRVFTLDEAQKYSAVLYEEVLKLCNTYRNYGMLFDALTDAKYKAKALFWERKCIQK